MTDLLRGLSVASCLSLTYNVQVKSAVALEEKYRLDNVYRLSVFLSIYRQG